MPLDQGVSPILGAFVFRLTAVPIWLGSRLGVDGRRASDRDRAGDLAMIGKLPNHVHSARRKENGLVT